MTRWDAERIGRYWDDQAREHGAGAAASWTDHNAIGLEIDQLGARIAAGQRVLDAGCGNGYTTLRLAMQHAVSVHGIDASEQMIVQARAEADRLRPSLRGPVTFEVGNITDLPSAAEEFDCVVCVRVLINLGTRPRQLQGLAECIRVLRPGGRLLLSEATLQGWRRLNRLRAEWGLPEIPMPPFNVYLDQDELAAAMPADAELVDIVDFASTYYVGTRVLKPLLARIAGVDELVADPGAEWNRFCAQLPAWGDYGTQKLFVIEKRAT